MLAAILRSTSPRSPGVLPLAGPPLVIRQLQWLRGFGCEKVAIELSTDDRGEEVRRLVAAQHAMARSVVFVRTAEPLAPRLLVGQAGFPANLPFLALSESVIGNADLRRLYGRDPGRGARVGRLVPPKSGGPFRPAGVSLFSPVEGPAIVERLPGWGTVIDTPGAALRLAREALLGALPPMEGLPAPSLLIHAAEQAPGVWVARGGRIQKGAVVFPPVLVEADARVCSGARIGPGAIIGVRAIIESGAIIEHALVESDTVVGEGLAVRETVATPNGLSPLDDDAPVLSLRDPLLLARRPRPLLRAAARLRCFSR
jgi:hypothetical protein